MQKAEHLKRHVAARRQLLEKVKAARRGETPMDVDPDSTTYPHRITTGTPSHPHHITKGTPSHPHCITKGTPSQPHRITKGTPSQPHPITKGTPSHPHPITKGTPSHPHRITAGTPSQPRGPYVPGVRLPSSIRPMSTGLQSRQRMAATPLERRGVCLCVCGEGGWGIDEVMVCVRVCVLACVRACVLLFCRLGAHTCTPDPFSSCELGGVW